MSDYNLYNFTVSEGKLVSFCREAAKAGCKPMLLVNGMYYEITGIKTESEGGADNE